MQVSLTDPLSVYQHLSRTSFRFSKSQQVQLQWKGFIKLINAISFILEIIILIIIACD